MAQRKAGRKCALFLILVVALWIVVGTQILCAGATSITPVWVYKGDFWKVSVSPSGKYIGAETRDNAFYLFKNDSNVPLWTYNTTLGNYGDIRFSSDERLVSFPTAVNNTWYTLVLNCEQGPTPIFECPGRGFMSSDGKHVATSAEGRISFFDIGNATPVWNYDVNAVQWDFSVSGNASYIVFSGENGAKQIDPLYVFSGKDGSVVWSREHVGQQFPGVGGPHTIVSDDGNYILAVARDSAGIFRAYFFSTSSSTPIWTARATSSKCSIISLPQIRLVSV